MTRAVLGEAPALSSCWWRDRNSFLIDLAKSFGKGVGFGLGLLFLGFIFFPILALGSASYVGPAAK